ncbi:MAG: MFS transporter [Chloroflexota bacterium]
MEWRRNRVFAENSVSSPHHRKRNCMHNNFNKLWLGQTISQVGTYLGALSLLAILYLDATPTQMGMLETLRALPALLIGLVAGVWVDRWRRRPILIYTDIGRAVLLLLVILLAFANVLHINHLYLIGLLSGTLTVFFNLAYRSYLPSLVSSQQLVRANARLSSTESIAEIASPGLGGLLVQWIGAPLTLLADATSFLFSAAIISRIPNTEPIPSGPANKQAISIEILEGIQTLLHHRQLRALAGASATRSFFGGFFAALYSLYVLRDIGLSPTLLGILIGAGGIGALVATLLIEPLSQRIRPKTLFMGSLFGSGLLGLCVPLAQGSQYPMLLLFGSQLLGDFCLAIYFILEMSLRQSSTPIHLLGRVNASFEFVTQGIGTAGIFIGGFVGATLGMRLALTLAVCGMIGAVGWIVGVEFEETG